MRLLFIWRLALSYFKSWDHYATLLTVTYRKLKLPISLLNLLAINGTSRNGSNGTTIRSISNKHNNLLTYLHINSRYVYSANRGGIVVLYGNIFLALHHTRLTSGVPRKLRAIIINRVLRVSVTNECYIVTGILKCY